MLSPNKMLMPPIDLSIIIVNWKSMEFVRQCLVSVCANVASLHYEVIVIDNASYDGCDEMIKSEFDKVTFIQSEHNLGFAQANNLAFTRSRGRNVLFLNPDTEIQGTAIQVLFSSLESISDAAMVGARLLNSDGTLQTTCVSVFPSILNQALTSNYLRRNFPALRIWGMRPLFVVNQSAVSVEAISGACMMCKRDMLIRVGCFSTNYFMYSEDTDLCLKMARMGAKIYYVPEAVILHHGGKSSSSHTESNFSAVTQRESLARFFEIHRGRRYATLYRASTVVIALCRLTIIVSIFPVLVVTRGHVFFRNAINKWSKILLWSFNASRR